MNLGELNFREFDRKWIVFDKKKDIQKICKKLKLKDKEGLFLGYVYISHEDGLQIKIAGNIIKIGDEYSLNQDMIYKKTSIPFSKGLKYHIMPVSENIIKNIKFTDQIEYHFESNYQKMSILESRKIENIDSYRHEAFIDDVELILNINNKKEYLWARIEDCSSKNLVFVCSLLDSSKYNKKYKENTLVLAKLQENDKTIDFVIDGIVDKVQK